MKNNNPCKMSEIFSNFTVKGTNQGLGANSFDYSELSPETKRCYLSAIISCILQFQKYNGEINPVLLQSLLPHNYKSDLQLLHNQAKSYCSDSQKEGNKIKKYKRLEEEMEKQLTQSNEQFKKCKSTKQIVNLKYKQRIILVSQAALANQRKISQAKIQLSGKVQLLSQYIKNSGYKNQFYKPENEIAPITIISRLSGGKQLNVRSVDWRELSKTKSQAIINPVISPMVINQKIVHTETEKYENNYGFNQSEKKFENYGLNAKNYAPKRQSFQVLDLRPRSPSGLKSNPKSNQVLKVSTKWR